MATTTPLLLDVDGGGAARARSVSVHDKLAVAALLEREQAPTTEKTVEELEPPLALEPRFLYSLNALPRSAIIKFSENWASLFFANVVHVPLRSVALYNTAANMFTFWLDPIVGWASDKSIGKLGRRKPIIAVSVPFAIISFFTSCYAPTLTAAGALWWYLLYLITGSFDFSVGPNNAWGAELTLRSEERVQLYSGVNVFAAVGSVCGAALPAALVYWLGGDVRAAYLYYGIAFSLFYGCTSLLQLIRVPERRNVTADTATSVIPAVIQAWQNVPFRVRVCWCLNLHTQYVWFQRLMLTGMLSRMGPSAISGFIFVLIYTQIFALNQLQVAVALGVTHSASAISSQAWRWLGRRIENRTGFICSMVLLIGCDIILVACAGDASIAAFPLAICLAAIGGVSNAANNVFSSAIYADCIEYDQLYSGRRREAQYDASQRIFWAFANILFGSLPYALFASAGYDESASVQPHGVILVLKGLILFGAVTDVLQIIVIWGYPLSRTVHGQIVHAVGCHALGKAALDPVRQRIVAPPVHCPVDGAIRDAIEHFWRWEQRLLCQYGTRALIMWVTCWIVGAIIITAVSIVVSLPAYSSKSYYWVFSALNNVTVFATGLFWWSVARLRPALRLHKANAQRAVVEYVAWNQ